MNLANKYIKGNKTFGCGVVSIGLRSLLPNKNEFALKKLWV